MAEATKYFDYIDSDIYILDKSFFGENEEECSNALRAIKYLFQYKVITNESIGVEGRVQSSNQMKPKVNCLGLIQEINTSNSEMFSLTRRQLEELNHLKKSIKESKRPFLLYIYGKSNLEIVNLDGIRYDMMSVFKDRQAFRKEDYSKEDKLTFEERGDVKFA